MKSYKSALASFGLAASLFFVGACAPDAAPNEPSSKLALLSNGPDLPEECNPCWDAFQDCFADGSDLQVCGDAIVECTEACQAPPPPPECLHCAAGFEACAQAAGDNSDIGGDCAAGFEGCLLACESDCSLSDQGCEPGDPGDPGDPGEPTDPNEPLDPEQCEIGFNECINDLWNQNDGNPEEAAQQCEELLHDCYADCPHPDEPGEPGDPDTLCDDAIDICLNSGQNGSETPFGDDVSCEEILQFCAEDPNQPDEPTDQEPHPDQPGW